MTKLVRTLIIINGLIIPAIVVVGVSTVIYKNVRKTTPRQEGIIVGEELDNAIEQELELQGLEYDSPARIYNSNSYYMPVSVMTYEEAMAIKTAISSANSFGYSMMKLTNVLFLDSTFNQTRWLLDRKASIRDLYVREPNLYKDDEEINPNYQQLIFEIGFEDSNNDGLINNHDFHDLYVSDLNGKNLTKVTEGIDILDYHFEENYSSIFIRYKIRDTIPDEHKLVQFGKYYIDSQEFKAYENLNNSILDYRSTINR